MSVCVGTWERLFQEAGWETDDKWWWETLRRNKLTTREAKQQQSEIVDRSSAQSIWKKFVTAVGQCFSIGKWIFKDLLLQHFLSVLWIIQITFCTLWRPIWSSNDCQEVGKWLQLSVVTILKLATSMSVSWSPFQITSHSAMWCDYFSKTGIVWTNETSGRFTDIVP
jgi:hypothetical protein